MDGSPGMGMEATAGVAVADPSRTSFDLTQVNCHACGYLRTGLPPGALCPECGAPPENTLAPALASAGAAQSRTDQAWLACVAAGLVLLVVTSLWTLQVALIMNLGGLVVAAVNAPAPKLWAATLLQ